jgi:hypothetical protein
MCVREVNLYPMDHVGGIRLCSNAYNEKSIPSLYPAFFTVLAYEMMFAVVKASELHHIR